MAQHRVSNGNSGFSLVELMVAIAIGMIAIVIVMQVFGLSEGSRRTTTGGDDAQNAGALALAQLQGDIQQAGYGFSNLNLLGCDVALPAPATWTLPKLAPVTINHGSIPAGDANTDTLLVVSGTGTGTSEGDVIMSHPDATTYTIGAPASYALNDRVIALAPGASFTTPCVTARTMDWVNAVPGATVTVNTGMAGAMPSTGWLLFNLGQTPRVVAYAVRNGNLTACDFMLNNCSAAGSVGDATIWVPIADNIVSLRATYGHDNSAPMDFVVDAYDSATPTTPCLWNRTLAIRIAIVARSGQMASPKDPDPTASAPVWSASASEPSQPIDLSSNSSWHRFRYRVFQTTAPIRNVRWTKDPDPTKVPPC